MIIKTFGLQHLPWLALSDECAPLRVRYKTMTVWNMRLVYIYILYPFENNIFCHGRQLFSQRHSLFVRKHTVTHTHMHTSMYTQELMANGSTWTKLSVHIYSMVIFFPPFFCATPCWPDLDGSLALSGECIVLKGRQHERARGLSWVINHPGPLGGRRWDFRSKQTLRRCSRQDTVEMDSPF